MGTLENHNKLYQNFKKDAENEDNYEASRVELYFLSIFHLIEVCAARQRIHINKHQKVRKILEAEKNIFHEKTENVWRLFQDIENRMRPKFTYGSSWNIEDFNKVKDLYSKLDQSV